MGVVRITNLDQVLQGINVTQQKLDNAAFQAVYQCALKIEDQAKLNANTGNHPKGTPRVSGTGPGPNVISGNLNSKIVGQRPIKGFKGYSATVDSSAEYARAVELGSPKWKSGVKYPYMEPAAQALINNGTLNRIFTGAFITAIRGS
jgi:hypothetical protein